MQIFPSPKTAILRCRKRPWQSNTQTKSVPDSIVADFVHCVFFFLGLSRVLGLLDGVSLILISIISSMARELYMHLLIIKPYAEDTRLDASVTTVP
jgi:hypothetical protein